MPSADFDQEKTTSPDLATRPKQVHWSWFSFFIGAAVATLVVGSLTRSGPREETTRDIIATESSSGIESSVAASESSMADVLQMANATLEQMRASLDDYTATFVKQETVGGKLGEPTEMSIKVQCSHRGGNLDESQPMRVYLRFNRPASIAGREVIWAKDLHDGKMVVHEAGLLGLMTLRLDPTGLIAMQGQRYPIWNIGLTNLAKKLIERGDLDRDNNAISVSIKHNMMIQDRNCDLIEVRRSEPSGRKDDFARAEIVIDTERGLPLRYTAFGWPTGNSNDQPLIESYTYLDIQTNVGLGDTDFDPANPSYKFP